MNDVIYRFLKSRAESDINADTLATLMAAGRGIDAVILNPSRIKEQEEIIDFSQITYYLAEICGTPVLMYSSEERDKYYEIMNSLRFGESIVYSGLTYAEMEVVKDFLDIANVDYKVSMGSDARMSLMFPKYDQRIMDQALKKLSEEVSAKIGEQYLTVKNQCWANTITQVTKALESDFAFIGSDGGQNGIRMDKRGAVVMTTRRTDYISRNIDDFQTRVMNVALEDLNGKTTPVKALFGKEAELITYGMDKYEGKALTLKEALTKTGFSIMPSLEQLNQCLQDAMKCEDMPEDKKKAVFALARMNVCRAMHVQDVKKLTSEEKAEYQKLHDSYLRQFEKEIRYSQDLGLQFERE